jgi:division protein CdvB (Snf7/Vps24/ESCRT-III family)
MSSNLSLGLTLTAVGLGSVTAAFGTVNKRITSIGQTVEKLKARQKTATDQMNRGWALGNNAVMKYAREVEHLDKRIAKLSAHKARLQTLGEQFDKNKAAMNAGYGSLLGAYGIARGLGAPVGAFIRQDDALNALQVAMLDKNGQVHASYEGIKQQAIELGNLLPGTTADFVNTARALMEQGVAYESVLNGGLKAASHLSVVLSMPTEQAGEMTAKLREAYKLTDDELPKMADMMQRGKFAFGMKPSDLMTAASYEAPVLNQLGISGLENARKIKTPPVKSGGSVGTPAFRPGFQP